MPAADPLISSGPATWGQEGRRSRALLWVLVPVVLAGLGVLGFFIGRGVGAGRPAEIGASPPAAAPEPGLQAQAPEGVPPSGEVSPPAEAELALTSPGAEGTALPETTPPESPSVASAPAGPLAGGLLPVNPRELAVQVAGEPDLQADATYEPLGNKAGGVTGFLVRGTLGNPTQNRVEKVVLTFTATGAIVVPQAAYEALIRPPGPAPSLPALQPYWNREVILAYQATVLPNLAPGEARPFEFVAPTNLKNPPGLRAGEVVQAGQPQEASLLVRAEGVAPSGTPVFPLQRP